MRSHAAQETHQGGDRSAGRSRACLERGLSGRGRAALWERRGQGSRTRALPLGAGGGRLVGGEDEGKVAGSSRGEGSGLPHPWSPREESVARGRRR